MNAWSSLGGIVLAWAIHAGAHLLAQVAMHDGSVVSRLLAPSGATPPWSLALALGFMYLRLAVYVVFPSVLSGAVAYWASSSVVARALNRRATPASGQAHAR